MDIRRTAAAAVVGWVLVVGAAGCGGSGEGATATTDPAADEVASDGTGNAEGNADADGDGEIDLPEDWPTDLVLPEGATVTEADDWVNSMNVHGTIAGELDAVTDEFAAAVEAAGFEVQEHVDEEGDGWISTLTRAADDVYKVRASVIDHDDGPEGELTFHLKIELPDD